MTLFSTQNPVLGDIAGAASYAPNATGGVNYFQGKAPITNTQYGMITGQDYGQIESQARAAYNAGQPTGNDPNAAGSGGGATTGGAASSINPTQVSQFDQSIGTLNSALGRIPNQLAIADSNIGHQFDQSNNELESGKTAANGNYTTSTNQNGQTFRTNKNTIADASSTGLQGLLRTLGAYGAGGSSDAQFVAPQAVSTQASQQRAGAGDTFAKNQSSLDTNWNNYLTGYSNDKAKLNDWKTTQLNSAQASTDSTKADLLSKLADLSGKKAAYMGGSYTGSAQPFIDQANAASTAVDNLGKTNPTYTGVAPVYTPPSLSSYEVNAGGAPTVGVRNATPDTSSPYLSLLLGGQNKTKNTLAAA